jgi:hypothetical protein
MEDCNAYVMRELDVYHFTYNAEQQAKIFESHHCFDGQLIVRGEKLVDTYWGLDPRGYDGRSFTLAEAQQKGILTFICNLNDVEKIAEWLYPQYADGDAFNLSHQHGCYKYYVAKKGAKKSVEKRLAIIEERIKKAKSDAEYAVRRAFEAIEQGHEQSARLAAGEDISV